jgi:hypothetical protein
VFLALPTHPVTAYGELGVFAHMMRIGLVELADLVEEDWFWVFATDHFVYEARQCQEAAGVKFWKTKQ